jgi:transposase InsO family protein
VFCSVQRLSLRTFKFKQFPAFLQQFLVDFRELFKTWKVVELRVLRSDNASEFNSAEAQQICRNNSIKREFSNPGQQFQSGKGEKCIGDVWLMTKTILLFSNVPRALWDEAWFNARYVKRNLPTTANEGFKSPIHMITGQTARLSHIFPFGSLIHFTVDKQQISDLKF